MPKFRWHGKTNDDFATGSNWDQGSAPTTDDVVVIDKEAMRGIAPSDQSGIVLKSISVERGFKFNIGSHGQGLKINIGALQYEGGGPYSRIDGDIDAIHVNTPGRLVIENAPQITRLFIAQGNVEIARSNLYFVVCDGDDTDLAFDPDNGTSYTIGTLIVRGGKVVNNFILDRFVYVHGGELLHKGIVGGSNEIHIRSGRVFWQSPDTNITVYVYGGIMSYAKQRDAIAIGTHYVHSGGVVDLRTDANLTLGGTSITSIGGGVVHQNKTTFTVNYY